MPPSTAQRVTIREGYQHPELGDIGGWSGDVLRTFTVGGTTFADVAVNNATLARLSDAARKGFYQRRMSFTRVRVAMDDTIPLTRNIPVDTGRPLSGKLQREWYDCVGYKETDPTKFASDAAYDGDYDEQKRETMKTLLAVGLMSMIILVSKCNEEDERNGGSSWGRGSHYS